MPAGCKDGSYRATFEDKPLLSDVIFLRAWVAVELPKFYNPITNLLDKHAGVLQRQNPAAQAQQQMALTAGGAGDSADEADAPQEPRFEPAAQFAGKRSGFAFKLGARGLGYYEDMGPMAAAERALPGPPPVAAAGRGVEAAGDDAWVGMRTVAQLRRELGVGAPRNSDSLYRDIERAPKVFNPLKVPRSLQAALPFKTKPKIEKARKRSTLEQKRAVVLEPHEKKAYTLVQQLNAIRNQKAKKRIEQQARRKVAYGKKKAAEEAWREKLSKDERKKRHRDRSKAEKIRELGSRRGGGSKKARRE